MKRSRVTDEQIIGILREQEAGARAADLCWKYGMSKAPLYNWKAKFGGMEVSDAKRLKALEDENANPKKLLAETMLDASALRDLLSKMWHYIAPGKPMQTATSSRSTAACAMSF
jgi:putative transposase